MNHNPKHHPKDGTGWQVCECGATRRVENGAAVGEWHACDLCVRVPCAPVKP